MSSFLEMGEHRKRVDMAVEEMKLLYTDRKQDNLSEKEFLHYMSELLRGLAIDIHTTEFEYYTGVRKLVG